MSIGLGDACSVVSIRDGVVEESFIYISTPSRILCGLRAETKFVELVRKNDSVVASDEIETYLDDGYYRAGPYSVCITWPNVG